MQSIIDNRGGGGSPRRNLKKKKHDDSDLHPRENQFSGNRPDDKSSLKRSNSFNEIEVTHRTRGPAQNMPYTREKTKKNFS